MVDFASLIKNSLSGINERFDEAIEDLDRVLEELTAGLKTVTKKPFAVDRATVVEDPSGSVFRVYFDFDPSNPRAETMTLEFIRVLTRGYPVQRGTFRKDNESFSPEGEFQTFERSTLPNPLYQ